MGLFQRLKDWERDVRAYYNTDLSTPENRRRAEIYNNWFDHAILRKIWTNFFEISPGVYRSNQPTHKRFSQYKEMGLKSVLNLRGKGASAHYLVEEESCHQLGLTLINANLHARSAATREEILHVIECMRKIERPFVMHCKSGADRAGFASAIYLMVFEGKSIDDARKMLSVKYIHLKWSKTGVLDYILECYRLRNARDLISFEDWIATEYDQAKMQSGFDNKVRPE